ncbi:MAG: hypothetical protein J6I40_07840 [Mailhella sp.]|nr:hypothetical protein [Mailhella sp.]
MKGSTRELLVLCFAIATLLGFLGYVVYSDLINGPEIADGSNSRALLPLVDRKWKILDVDEGRNSGTYVLELEHGWLIHRSSGFGGGMTFVPKAGR